MYSSLMKKDFKIILNRTLPGETRASGDGYTGIYSPIPFFYQKKEKSIRTNSNSGLELAYKFPARQLNLHSTITYVCMHGRTQLCLYYMCHLDRYPFQHEETMSQFTSQVIGVYRSSLQRHYYGWTHALSLTVYIYREREKERGQSCSIRLALNNQVHHHSICMDFYVTNQKINDYFSIHLNLYLFPSNFIYSIYFYFELIYIYYENIYIYFI